MLKIYIRVFFVTFVLYLTLHSCDALRNRGYNSKYESQNYKSSNQKATMNTGQISPSFNITRRGLGISAWGLVTLIISCILAIVGLYYFSICYPVLCKKSRNYGMMEQPTIA